MPRLRNILVACVLVLLLSVGATALLSNVQRLRGEVTLDRSARPERPVVRARTREVPVRRVHALRDTHSAPGGGGARATEPRIAYAPAPSYPVQALRELRQGLVTIRVRLSPDGRVTEASVQQSSGDPELDQAALHAVRRWAFDMPAHARREVVLPIRFHIDAPHP